MSRLLARAEAAGYLNVSVKWLANKAYKPDGPPFIKVGKHCRYRISDLDAWLRLNEVK